MNAEHKLNYDFGICKECVQKRNAQLGNSPAVSGGTKEK